MSRNLGPRNNSSKHQSRATHTSHRTARNTAGLIAVGLVGLGATLGTATPAQAKVTTLCSSSSFECDETGYGKVAQKSYWTMAPGHNCTNYMAYRLIQDGMPKKITWLNNAGDWARQAKQKGFLVDMNPTVGSIAQWNNGAGGMSSSGHVAYVIAVSPNSITVAEDNYSSGPLAIRTITTNDPGYPSNIIHFTPGSMSAPTATTAVPATSASDWLVFVSDHKRAFDA